MTKPKKAILYHANCHDGFGAAWAAWRKLGNNCTYLAVQHAVPPPELPQDTEIYILDFAYSRKQVEAMRKRYGALTIIDHHLTAQKELVGLDYALFDNSKSGAVLAWEHFHPGEPLPELLKYIMDRDLWRYELPNSREVSAALSSHPMDFELWSSLEIETLAQEGVPILRSHQELVSLLCQQARMETLVGHRVPVVNAAAFGSDVGNELLRRYPDAPFAVVYFDRADGKRQWSLRSRESFDVSKIARLFRNGGHLQAAGFETPLPDDFMPKPR